MRKYLLNSFLLATIALLSACQTAPLNVVHVKKENFNEGNYVSFKVSHTSVDAKQEAKELITNAIAEIMIEKGYVDGANPDFEIRYSIKTSQSTRLEVQSPESMGIEGHPPQMEAVFEARMLVNVIDTKTNEVIWKAASSRDLSQVNIQKFDASKAHDRMHEMFENFPARYWW